MTSEDAKLVAYLVAEQSLDNEALRAFLQARLPVYMIPSFFIALEKLPLTPNGKVNRRTLAERALDYQINETTVAPRNPQEELLAGIWCEVLKLKTVGMYDNFFELGGHSLRLTQVLTRISETFGVDLLLRQVYAEPTISASAELVTLEMFADDPDLVALLDEL